jgi:undecaprenyl-diphosphatase
MAIDLFIFQQINGLAGRYAWLDAIGVFFAQYFEYILIVLLFVFLWRKWRLILGAFSAAVLARFGVVELIRYIWSRPRPFVENNVNLLVEAVNEPSFPSGHAVFYFALSFIVYQHNKKAGIFFFGASFLIVLSRVFVGIHWPSDILAGAVIGALVGWLIMLTIKKGWWARWDSNPHEV